MNWFLIRMEISHGSHFPEFSRVRMLVLCLHELGKTSKIIHYTHNYIKKCMCYRSRENSQECNIGASLRCYAQRTLLAYLRMKVNVTLRQVLPLSQKGLSFICHPFTRSCPPVLGAAGNSTPSLPHGGYFPMGQTGTDLS